MKLSIQQVENGFIVTKNEFAPDAVSRVFHNDEKGEMLKDICEILEIGSEIMDWSDWSINDADAGGTPSADKISEKDI